MTAPDMTPRIRFPLGGPAQIWQRPAASRPSGEPSCLSTDPASWQAGRPGIDLRGPGKTVFTPLEVSQASAGQATPAASQRIWPQPIRVSGPCVDFAVCGALDVKLSSGCRIVVARRAPARDSTFTSVKPRAAKSASMRTSLASAGGSQPRSARSQAQTLSARPFLICSSRHPFCQALPDLQGTLLAGMAMHERLDKALVPDCHCSRGPNRPAPAQAQPPAPRQPGVARLVHRPTRALLARQASRSRLTPAARRPQAAWSQAVCLHAHPDLAAAGEGCQGAPVLRHPSRARAALAVCRPGCAGSKTAPSLRRALEHGRGLRRRRGMRGGHARRAAPG